MTVVLIHGFTGSPAEMGLLADAFHSAGYSVEVPLLAGHGTALNDLMSVGTPQWIDPLDALISRLLAAGQMVVIGGLSLGSILALQLAFRYPEIRPYCFMRRPFAAEIHAAFWRLFSPGLRNLCQSRLLTLWIRELLIISGLTTVIPFLRVRECSISSPVHASSSRRFISPCWR